MYICFFIYCPAGARCRFASSSASQDSCIFPCRCTKGCNTTTGDCLDDGRCVDGHPSDHRWSGPACQIGSSTHIYARTHAHTHAHTHTRTHAHTHTRTHTHSHTCIHMHTHIYTHQVTSQHVTLLNLYMHDRKWHLSSGKWKTD